MIHKVKRQVDTVVIEMDIDVAEQLVEALRLIDVVDSRCIAVPSLRSLLIEKAEVRSPSALYKTEGAVLLRTTTAEEMTDIREQRFA